MLRRRASLALATSLVSAALFAPSIASADTSPHFQSIALDNGLQVLLVEDHRAPRVAVDVAYDVGTRDEPSNRRGIVEVMRVLMRNPSTRHVGRNVVDRMFHALEIAPYARDVDLRVDRTIVGTSGPSNELELMLWLESDRMGFFLDGVDEHSLSSARDDVDGERRHSEESASFGNVPSLINQAMYPTEHPYHSGAFGIASDVESITHADLVSFVHRFYVPNNATLVIAGDFDPAKTTEQVKKYFGPIIRGDGDATHVDAAPVTLASEVRMDVESKAELSKLVVSWPTPAFQTEGDQALDAVASLLLAGTDKGRLAQRLTKDAQVARTVLVSEFSRRLGSQFQIHVVLERGKKPEEALAIIDEELDRIRKGAVPRDEMETARMRLLTSTSFASDPFALRAGAIASEFLRSAPDKTGAREYRAGYAALTPEKIQQAAVTFLPATKRIVTIVKPNPDAPLGGRLVGAK